ncbi:hypothetical protein B0O80DRAFT_499706 [Mortierella sp. GBAus27b]|nr:hypothetical protein B0O80DRAFT_499706 [Mortierella sp. GBAus27b]
MAQHHHALNLPEVLFQIARQLDSHEDVVACSLVCKSFRASFEPYLWMNVHLEFANTKLRGTYRQDPLTRVITLPPWPVRYRQHEQGQVSLEEDRILNGLQRVAPWIRSLAVLDHSFPGQLRLGDRCTGITSLYIAGIPCDERFHETYWNDCEALLTQNSAGLRSLTLVSWTGCNGYYYDGQPLWRPLLTCVQHANLTTLRIKYGGISKRKLEAFLRIYWQLEILELMGVHIQNTPTHSSHNSPSQVGHELMFEEQVSTSVIDSLTDETSTSSSTPAIATTTTVRLPKLRELTLDMNDVDSEYQLEQILLHCPLLQILVWRTARSNSHVRRFCEYLAAQTWPCLDWIEIESGEGCTTDQEHALLLQSAPRPFRCLDANTRSLEEQTFNLYRDRGHFATLTKIDLRESMALSLPPPPGSSVITVISRRVQEVLESCPALEHMVAVILNGQDIIQGKPWVCRRLRKFEVMINMQLSDNSHTRDRKRKRFKYTDEDKRQCYQIFEQLGQLSQLTVLDMRLYWSRWIRRSGIKAISLPLRLRMGLGYLSTLRNLEVIGYHGSQEIRVGDLEWMLQHWTKLQKIQGTLSVKWSRTSEGVPDERSRLVMETLKARKWTLTGVWSDSR